MFTIGEVRWDLDLTPLALKHLAEGLISNTHKSIALATKEYENGLIRKHDLESRIAINFTALWTNLTAVVSAMKDHGYGGDGEKYQALLDMLNWNASTIDGMAKNIATAFEKIEATR